MPKPWQPSKDPRVTNESCWKATDDNLLPNPPTSKEHEMVDEVYAEATKEQSHDTKVIMAHEFRENPDSFKAVAQQVADSYNDQHALTVGGDAPIDFDEEESND